MTGFLIGAVPLAVVWLCAQWERRNAARTPGQDAWKAWERDLGND